MIRRFGFPAAPRLAALLATLVWSACADTASTPGTIADAPEIPAEVDLRIDGHEHELVPIGWLGVSPRGEIAIAQLQDATIRFFDADGSDMGLVGGRGEGPGQFVFPARGGWVGDSLWVWDINLARTSVFTPAREFVRDFRPPSEIGPHRHPEAGTRSYAGTGPSALYPGDTALVGVSVVVEGAAMDHDGGYPILQVGPDGTVVSDVATSPLTDGILVRVPVENGVDMTVVPFYPMPLWTVTGDGSRIGMLDFTSDSAAAAFRVRVVDRLGSPRFERVFRVEPVAISPSVRDSVIDIQVARKSPATRDRIGDLLQERTPNRYPPANDLILGSDGRSWVALQATPEGRPWLAISATGEPIGRVILPEDAGVRAADATHLWAVERDDLGVESVVRYRLLPPGEER